MHSSPQRFEPLAAFSKGRRPHDLTLEHFVTASQPSATFGIPSQKPHLPFHAFAVPKLLAPEPQQKNVSVIHAGERCFERVLIILR